MRGFIDLVFRREGRFFIVDYKYNRLGKRLGKRLQDYGRDGLREAIRQHRYDLQYLIYCLALHRFLGWRLPGYDFECHFGGVYYLFLRGMRPDRGSETGVWYDRPPRELIDGLDCLFGGGRLGRRAAPAIGRRATERACAADPRPAGQALFGALLVFREGLGRCSGRARAPGHQA